MSDETSARRKKVLNGNYFQITRNKPVMKPASGTRKCNCRQEMVTRNLGPGRFQMIQQTVSMPCAIAHAYIEPNIILRYHI